VSATDYRKHFVNQTYCVFNATHYFCKHAKIKVIYQINWEISCCFIASIQDTHGCNEDSERQKFCVIGSK